MYIFFSVDTNDNCQKLQFGQSISNNVKIVEQNSVLKISSEELNPPKKKNILGRLVKTVENFSIKVVPPNWNKSKSNKKKVKAMSL